MLWNLKYSSQNFQQTSTKLGERDLKPLGMLNCGGIFDISNGLPSGEAMKLWSRIEIQVSPHTLSDFDHTSVVCLVYEADRIDVTIMSQSYSATNWQQKCVIFKML